jgi:hypothetical protein
MAVDPSVRIDIAAEFTGKKAFTQADKSTDKLTKSVKSLAKGFIGVFAAQKLIQFGKASVKAFAEDDAAAKSLAKTLENLGLAFGSNTGTVNGFINRLEAQTGVLDDELRPAMDRLLRATGDVAKSQELLNLALDIAAGTGKSVTQVSQSLQKAYLGQTQAIGRLGVGLTKAEIASGSFEEIQKKLNTLFEGQATAAANTYQGSLNKLTVAGNNAKETIGKGLVDALNILSSSSTIDPTVSGIDRIANAMADATTDAAKFIKVMQVMFSDLSFFKNEATTAAALRIKQGTGFTTPMSVSSQDTQKADQVAKKAAEAKAKALQAAADKEIKLTKLTAAAKLKADKLAAAAKKKSDAASAALTKAAAVFDLAKIAIAAALKSTYDKDERLRLLAMQAIEDDNGEAALKYIEQLKLLTAEQQTNKLAGIKTISETELNYINQLLLDELQRIKTTKMSEEEAAAARAAAYAKYNAAIIASGGLAVANFYTEKTQIELLAIAKLAALDTVAAAQATIDILNYTSQTDIIARVAAAQLLADETKAKALSDYLKGYDAGIAAIATSQTLTDAEKLAALTTYLNTASAAITALGGSQKTIDDAKMAALKAYLAEATKPITQVITIKYDVIGAPPTAVIPGAPPLIPDLPGTNTGPKFGVGGQPIWENGMSPGYNTGQGTGSVDNSVTIVVEGNVLDGDDFTDKVNDALLDSIRKGRSQYPAGFIPG